MGGWPSPSWGGGGDHQTLGHMYIYIYVQGTGTSLRTQAPVFSGNSNQDSFAAMSASCAIQAASIFYLDNLLATASAQYTSSCLLLWLFFSTSTFFPATILDLSYSTPSSRLMGKPCTVSSTSHTPSLLEPVLSQPSLTWSQSVSFGLPYSPACNSSQFSTSSTFSPGTFFSIFHTSLQGEDKGGSLPHQFLLLTLFLCWNVHSSSFCTEGRGHGNFHFLFSRD